MAQGENLLRWVRQGWNLSGAGRRSGLESAKMCGTGLESSRIGGTGLESSKIGDTGQGSDKMGGTGQGSAKCRREQQSD